MNPSNPLIDFLLKQLGWTPASVVTLATGLKPREIRDLASKSGGFVLSSDQGYKLTTNATADEIRACVARLRAHAAAEVLKAEQIEKVGAAIHNVHNIVHP